MGFLPIAKDLPIAFTKMVDKHRKIMKHTQGTIEGWTLHAEDEQRVRESTEQEIILLHQPLKIYIRKKSREPMPQHLGLPPQVYALGPCGVNWSLNPPANTLWVRRFGFHIRPDFASTVHAVTGDELDAAIASFLPVLRRDDRVDDAVRWLRNPPLGRGIGPAYRILFAGAVASLPDRYRRLLGLRRPWWPALTATRILLFGMRALLGPESSSRAYTRRRLDRLGLA